MNQTYSESEKSRVKYISKGMEAEHLGEDEVHHRQKLLRNWDQHKLATQKVACIGAGGLGSRVLQNLARMGIGHIAVCDGDYIELSNLHTHFFYHDQVGGNKATNLAGNLTKECTHEAQIEGYAEDFPDIFSKYPHAFENSSLLLCMVDNEETRYGASKYAFEENIPAVFAAVSNTTLNGYVFVQNNQNGCFRCLWHSVTSKEKGRVVCKFPSVIYIHATMAGMVTYATTAILLDWVLQWSYFELFLNEGARTIDRVEKYENCHICGRK